MRQTLVLQKQAAVNRKYILLLDSFKTGENIALKFTDDISSNKVLIKLL